MFCPRCGRQVNENANFCGGCGLSKREIDAQMSQRNAYTYTAPVFEKAPEQTGEVESFVEQPFPTDVEYKDVEETTVEIRVDTTEEEPQTEQRAQDNTVSDSAAHAARYNVQQAVPPQYGYSQQYQAPTAQRAESNDQNISTVDYIWMMLVSVIPIIGLLYLLYLAFAQSKNINKRSFARATLILTVFAALIAAMFVFGFFMANFIY